ncbi:MAG TPA: tetratricopeptide repeat protein [bacterium]|nr:tetratricopeptide repeat protein [bacterium]
MPDAKRLTEKGFALAKEGKFEKALRHFETALTQDPRYVEAIYGQGAVHYKLRDFRRAREFFSQVLNFDPTHERSIKYLHRCDDQLEQASYGTGTGSVSSWGSSDVTLQWGGIQKDQSLSDASDAGGSQASNTGVSDWGVSSSVPEEESRLPVEPEPPQDSNRQTQAPKRKPKAPIRNTRQMIWIFCVNAVLVVMLVSFLYGVAGLFRGEPQPKLLTPESSRDTEPESGESITLRIENDNVVGIVQPEPEESHPTEEKPSVQSDGSAVLPELLAILGLVLALPPYIGFLVSAFQESFLKGVLFLWCCCYSPWYIFVEYKSESKWLHIGVYLVGNILCLVAHLLGSEIARYFLRRMTRF